MAIGCMCVWTRVTARLKTCRTSSAPFQATCCMSCETYAVTASPVPAWSLNLKHIPCLCTITSAFVSEKHSINGIFFFQWIKGKFCYNIPRLFCCHSRISLEQDRNKHHTKTTGRENLHTYTHVIASKSLKLMISCIYYRWKHKFWGNAWSTHLKIHLHNNKRWAMTSSITNAQRGSNTHHYIFCCIPL